MVADYCPSSEPIAALIAAPSIAGLLPASIPEKPVGIVKFVGMLTIKRSADVIALQARCQSSEYISNPVHDRPRSGWEASQMATAQGVINGSAQPFESRYRDMLLAAAAACGFRPAASEVLQ